MAENKKTESYELEAAMKRLDEVSEALANENVGLAESLALYEEGVSLVKLCTEQLDAVERKINILRMSDDGEVSEQRFDTTEI